jgi:hypothetical protein
LALPYMLKTGVGVVLLLMMGLVLYRMTTGRIRMAGLLSDPTSGLITPDRVQMLVFSLIGAVAYLSIGLRHGAGMPIVDPELLFAYAGSHVVYVSAKAYRAQNGADSTP